VFLLIRKQKMILMGETNSQLTYGDPASAKEVLEVTLKLFDLQVDLKTIIENSKKIEQSFSEITKNLEKMNNKEESTPNNYIR
jgi:proteasome assembly chaperone (PAC2) family protein